MHSGQIPYFSRWTSPVSSSHEEGGFSAEVSCFIVVVTESAPQRVRECALVRAHCTYAMSFTHVVYLSIYVSICVSSSAFTYFWSIGGMVICVC
jgi:hypothetical protein